MGAAGLATPSLVGFLFDRYHDYRPALVVAAVAAAASALASLAWAPGQDRGLEGAPSP